MVDLSEKKCVPCQGGSPLSEDKVTEYFLDLPKWKLEDKKIVRVINFKDFNESMRFVNKIANIAEKEGHHPDIHVHWNKVTLYLWTHMLNGLSENDFIMATKINKLI